LISSLYITIHFVYTSFFSLITSVLFVSEFIMPSPVVKGTVSVAFVRPYVRPSVRRVAYIANNSGNQRP